MRNGNVEGKHVFAGQTRIASKLCDKDNAGQDETGTYYFHGDHLGSSSVITDEDGKFFEALEYFPYGETWVKEGSESKSLPFKFTGKEEDPETGLYYYGARYYDAKVSRWCSVDPILEDYLPDVDDEDFHLPGYGGVFNSINLNLYHYAANNPIRYKDLDGNLFWDVVDVGLCGWSWKDMYDEPSLGNLGWAVFDTAALLPIWPSSGYIRRPAKAISKLSKAKKAKKVLTWSEKAYKAIGRGKRLTDPMKKALRRKARDFFVKHSKKAADLIKKGKKVEIHHLIPLEWAHKMGKKFNPNKLENLVGLEKKFHTQISKMWSAFKKDFPKPTKKQIEMFAKRVNEKFGKHFIR